MTDRAKIIEILKRETSFNLISHMLPDGDSIGSLLAMGEGLRRLGREVRMYTPGLVPRKYAFLEGAERILHEDFAGGAETITIVLDSSDADRLGVFKDAVMAGKEVINIDHHVTNQRFGHLNLVDADASATGEIVYHILVDLGVSIDRSIAEALYVAISTDTGSFKYENTAPGTHRVVARLLEHGINPGALSQKIFDEHPLPFYMMLREAISSLEMYAGSRVAVMTLSRDLRQRYGAGPDDLEGIVNYTRNIEGVELGILFYVDRENEVKVGFRSKSLDVSVLAGRFNGGGHARASGCRLEGEFEAMKDRVLTEALIMVDALPHPGSKG